MRRSSTPFLTIGINKYANFHPHAYANRILQRNGFEQTNKGSVGRASFWKILCEQTSKGSAGTLLVCSQRISGITVLTGGFVRLLASDLAKAMPTFVRLLARHNGKSISQIVPLPKPNKRKMA